MCYFRFITALAAVALSVMAHAADFVDKNGRIYRNYRIKEIRNGEALVLFSLADGMPEAAYVRVELLPDDLQIKYGYKKAVPVKNARKSKPRDWRSGRTLREKLVLAADQLDKDLQRLPMHDRDRQYQTARKLLSQVESVLAGYGETAEFELISNDRKGALVRVVGTGKGSHLRSRQHIYLRGSRVQSRAFRMRVYPAGDVMNYGKYGRIAIYGASTKLAGEVAADFIAGSIGRPAVFQAPVVQSVPPAVNEAVNSGVVNNVYYVEDNRKRYVYTDDRSRSSKKRIQAQKSGCSQEKRPNRNPGKHPGEGERPARERKVADELPKNKPIRARQDRQISNYGLLPEWARPGQTEKK